MPRRPRPPPIQDHILAALSKEYERLTPHLQSISLPLM
jgi:hypothetical protein